MTPSGPPGYWELAKAELAARDPFLADLVARHRPLLAGSRGDAFQTLARAIVGQQISVKAAQSVWARFVLAVRAMTPQAVLAADPGALRAAGLSVRKAEYVQDLARRFASGEIEVSSWPDLDDEAIIEQLVRVRGIGRWTAEMYLIFNLGRPDVLPIDDLGLQKAMSLGYNRGRPLSEKRMRTIARAWSPWRSVATWYLWRSLEPVGVEP